MQPQTKLTIDEIMAKSKYECPADFQAMDMPKLGIAKGSFVALDTETTGLGIYDEVVELSILNDSGEEIYHSFFEPTQRVNPEAAATTGLTNAVLKGQPKFVDEWDKIVAAIDGRRIAGHNIAFDKRLMEQSLRKYGHMEDAEHCTRMFEDRIDTRKVASAAGVKRGDCKLGVLCDAIGVEQKPNHRASHDCLGVLYVLQHCEQYENFYDEKPTPYQPQMSLFEQVSEQNTADELQRIAYHDLSHGQAVQGNNGKFYYPVEFMYACDDGQSRFNPYLVSRQINGQMSHACYLAEPLYQNLIQNGRAASDDWGVIDAKVEKFYPLLTDKALEAGLVRRPDKPFDKIAHDNAVQSAVRPLPDVSGMSEMESQQYLK